MLMSASSGNFGIAGNNIFARILNIVLPIAGAGIMFYYEYCETSCSYLGGTFMGIDLKYTGILFMIMLLVSSFAAGRLLGNSINVLRTFLISAAVGAEFILIKFQVVNEVYCLFCLFFAACVFLLFMVNFRGMNKILMFTSVAAGLIGFILFFKGNIVPFIDLSF
jgi:hypothetical protein